MEAQERSDWVLLNFLEFEKSLNGGARLPLHQKRRAAFDSYSKAGFPTASDEEWRYTNPVEIKTGNFSALFEPSKLDASVFAAARTESLDAYRIFIVDGVPLEWNVPAGEMAITTICSGGSAVENVGTIAPVTEQFAAINTSFLRDGLIIIVKKGRAIPKPVELVWISGPNASGALVCPRLFVEVEEGASCTVIERFVSLGASGYLNNAVFEGRVGENARLDHYRVEDESLDAFHISTIRLEARSNSAVKTHTFSFGGKLVRNNVHVRMEGTGIDVTMNGLSALSGSQHVDNNTVLDHARPHCESHELYKGIYADRSQGVFSGTIIVEKEAQKTNAIQSNRSLLLSDNASVNTKPQLKIWADDVKCTHGATVGQLDDDALFYIQSRGVGQAEAKHMLVRAFAGEVISEVKVEALRSNLEEMLSKKLSA